MLDIRRPPLDPQLKRSKHLTLLITEDQRVRLKALGEMSGEPRTAAFVFKMVSKVLNENSEAIDLYLESKNKLKSIL